MMLERACRLKSNIKEWLAKEEYRSFASLYPTNEEWRQIEYVITILHPFLKYTVLVSRTKGVTINKAWLIYNRLFTHMEVIEETLKRKRTPWKVSIRNAVRKAREKLDQYYSNTDESNGLLYNLGTVLDPSLKLSIYESDDWGEVDRRPGITWESLYQSQFLQFYKRNYIYNQAREQHDSSSSEDVETIQAPSRPSAAEELENELTFGSSNVRSRAGKDKAISGRKRSPYAEATLYLTLPTEKLPTGVSVLDWWKLNESKFPTLAKMARDILSTPIAGVGVERVFSVGRDVITYRRNRLKSKTISDIMVCRDWWRVQQDEEEEDKDEEEKEELEVELLAEYEDRQWVNKSVDISDNEETLSENEQEHNSAEEEIEENNRERSRKRRRMEKRISHAPVYTY